ncbi:hypothetical protein EHI8A_068950 [Entamoeba histolytica HM-1:IMSS-B]|uniref:TLDc domain-containing protein n=6 Tax=Entamoeba histolytica TaxID=5759 RepID=C4M3T6_ENTH1|nr:hypothetical protein EHI_163550 [Entamoeba histolytica HM-1:IMSS]EMD46974.1 Hypothetical protein EHI5A_072220 [Entamoeba histolytica KU27]EMH74735.1 hypothetical protein EHI8A_068950 [Entamoeba histolytica HM-1:IMSS-B]EMS14352.1 hypothetical protein KM1_128010 [Entamoeba histolytica HM-3:IMSS]ENY61741.1 hypothetical protein EHI7A_063030 [Entamoeba histolytica HM-1:IMSS-A]GAT95999.1 hypothetical protein CL6EHI_163550 [Entamoeba histolytica]|eukprot:XP_653714.1 hypothetical protein EHI_163550 [Entamoeba histolytica HM-1:IMSS]
MTALLFRCLQEAETCVDKKNRFQTAIIKTMNCLLTTLEKMKKDTINETLSLLGLNNKYALTLYVRDNHLSDDARDKLIRYIGFDIIDLSPIIEQSIEAPLESTATSLNCLEFDAFKLVVDVMKEKQLDVLDELIQNGLICDSGRVDYIINVCKTDALLKRAIREIENIKDKLKRSEIDETQKRIKSIEIKINHMTKMIRETTDSNSNSIRESLDIQDRSIIASEPLVEIEINTPMTELLRINDYELKQLESFVGKHATEIVYDTLGAVDSRILFQSIVQSKDLCLIFYCNNCVFGSFHSVIPSSRGVWSNSDPTTFIFSLRNPMKRSPIKFPFTGKKGTLRIEDSLSDQALHVSYFIHLASTGAFVIDKDFASVFFSLENPQFFCGTQRGVLTRMVVVTMR